MKDKTYKKVQEEDIARDIKLPVKMQEYMTVKKVTNTVE